MIILTGLCLKVLVTVRKVIDSKGSSSSEPKVNSYGSTSLGGGISFLDRVILVSRDISVVSELRDQRTERETPVGLFLVGVDGDQTGIEEESLEDFSDDYDELIKKVSFKTFLIRCRKVVELRDQMMRQESPKGRTKDLRV